MIVVITLLNHMHPVRILIPSLEQFRRKIPNELTMEKRITIVLFILSTMFTSKYPVSCTKISSRITFDSQNGGEKLDLNEVGSTDF